MRVSQGLPSSAPRPASAMRSNGLVAVSAILLTLLLSAWLSAPARAEFGIESGSFAAGISSVQAGGHGDLSLKFRFNTHPDPHFTLMPDDSAKTLSFELPPGLVGNPQATPKCSAETLRIFQSCPSDTQVGVIRFELPRPVEAPVKQGTPVYNMVPENGRTAELGFVNMYVVSPQIHILASVRTGSDNGISTEIPRLPGNLHPINADVQIWGVPADPSHDTERGSVVNPSGGCLTIFGVSTGSCPSNAPDKPFLSNPTQCSTPVSEQLKVDSYEHPGLFTPTLVSTPQVMTGCEALPFSPSISAQPSTQSAGAPSGYSVDLHVPQTESPSVPATAQLKKAVVTLPAGVRVSPSAAAGLGACSEEQIGFLGSGFPEPSPLHFTQDEAQCPDSAKIGTVVVRTPLLSEPLEGGVYLATPHANPFGTLMALYVVVKGSGVLIKLAGEVRVDPSTGQLTATFDHNPQQPFEDLVMDFKTGSRAPLTNPPSCGSYTTTSKLTPWSTPITADATPAGSFEINQGCGAHGFAPTLTAGTTNNQAGAFSPLTLTITRADSDQELSTIQVSTPPGLLGKLSSVVPCPEPQASQGKCSPESQIGHTMVSAGPGATPLSIPEAGKPQDPVYLTTGYTGTPYGLSVVVPAEAGPFNLGTVIERAAISVDSHTSQITVKSDPLPRILEGIPLQVRTVNVIIDRPGFIFNPTNCAALTLNASITSIDGATAALSNQFAVSACPALKFKPKFSMSTQAKTSKRNGASLRVHVVTGEGPGSGEANIAKVDVELPNALPSRDETLKKACLAAQFEKDPAGCPEGAFVGTAVAHTPILSSPLTGPAILVSHGGAAFPDLVLVLQGEGVRIDLTGRTNIKGGRTFSRFETVPDAPVSSFELVLPEGPGALLGAFLHHQPALSLCGSNLVAPATIEGQDGAVIKQNTRIGVTGCAKATKASKAKKARARQGRHASAASKARSKQ